MKQAQTHIVPIALIDEPPIAMRSSMNDDALRELAQSIASDGLINPISVCRIGERYEIKAGHRRFMACKMLGRDEVEVRDFTETGVTGEAIKCAENLYREDVNDADMADYLYDLQEHHGYTLEQFIAVTRKSEAWISARLKLYGGDKRVFDALREGSITLAHATLLNKFPDDFRLMYLQNVIAQTPPVRVLQDWLRDVKQIVLGTAPVEQATAEQAPAAPLPGFTMDKCALCDSSDRSWDMSFEKVHKQCLSEILKAIESAGIGGQ